MPYRSVGASPANAVDNAVAVGLCQLPIALSRRSPFTPFPSFLPYRGASTMMDMSELYKMTVPELRKMADGLAFVKGMEV